MLQRQASFDNPVRNQIKEKVILLTNQQKIELIDLCIAKAKVLKEETEAKIQRYNDIILDHCDSTDMEMVLLGKKLAVEDEDLIRFILNRFIKEYRSKLAWSDEKVLEREEDLLFWHIDYTFYSLDYFIKTLHFEINLINEYIDIVSQNK